MELRFKLPDLVRVNSSMYSRLTQFAFHLFDLAAYEYLYRFSPARGHRFFNGGYLPVDENLLQIPEFEGEEHCAMMYHLLLHTLVKQFKLDPKQILDVGCGQGGGVQYATRFFPEAKVVGIDRNSSVIRLARKNLSDESRASFKATSGQGIPFPQDTFDFVLGVGTPTYFGLPKFIELAQSVLQAGGTLAFSGGYRQGVHQEIEGEVRKAASDNGLEFVSYTDITPNTFASLKADVPRRIRAVERVPWPFRIYAYKWTDLPGSTEYQEYAEGKRADFAVVLRKPE